MTRLLITRVVITLIGVAVWGYGQRTEQPQLRIIGMVILAIALLLRFAPRRWFGANEP
jgi:chromate transport protein ChrA